MRSEEALRVLHSIEKEANKEEIWAALNDLPVAFEVVVGGDGREYEVWWFETGLPRFAKVGVPLMSISGLSEEIELAGITPIILKDERFVDWGLGAVIQLGYLTPSGGECETTNYP